MKGTNTLILNEATMIEVIQQYMDRQFASFSPKVTGIKFSCLGSLPQCEITLLSDEEQVEVPKEGQ
jgi:hypothetical protein